MPAKARQKVAAALDRLKELEDNHASVINTTPSIRNCRRDRLTSILLQNGIPYPDSFIIDTTGSIEERLRQKGMESCWLKRSDAHTTHPEDIGFAPTADGARRLLASFAARGIGRDGDIKSINIHGSILPRWRGAAPVQRAIETGDAVTGITLMKMEAGLDTGPMILTSETAITDTDTSVTLFERLTEMGAELIVKALEQADSLTREAQPEEGVTYAEKILKSEAPIDWSLPAEVVARRIRAFNPFPFATAVLKGETVKIRNAATVDACGKPGEVLQAGHRLIVACGSGAIDCLELQRAGKPAMPAAAFVQSTGLTVGDVLQ